MKAHLDQTDWLHYVQTAVIRCAVQGTIMSNLVYRGLTLDGFQRQAIEHLQSGRSVLVAAPTSTGKRWWPIGLSKKR